MDDLIIWILCTVLAIIGLLNLCFLCFRGRISNDSSISRVTRADVPIISSPIYTVSQRVATGDIEQSHSVNIIPPSYATLMRCRDLDDIQCKSSYDATESSALSTTEASTITSDSQDGLVDQEDRFMSYFIATDQLTNINSNFMATQAVRLDDSSSLNEDTLTIENTTRSPVSDQLLSSL